MKNIRNTKTKQFDLLGFASRLVRIPSCSETKNRELRVGKEIYSVLKKEGLNVELIEAEQGRYNVIATLKGYGGGKSLMLCGHLDTVPAYDMINHLSGEIKEGKLYGRGSCDMKGSIAAMVAALIDIKRENKNLKGDLIFAGVIDEEGLGKGIEYIAKNGPFTDGAIIGEPTDMKLAIGHKGLEWMKVIIKGKKVHAGKMENGVNAISMAGIFIDKLSKEYAGILSRKNNSIIGLPTINIGRITGGDQPSTVADNCVIEIDRRWTYEEDIDQVYEEIRGFIDEIKKVEPRFLAEVDSYFNKDIIIPHKPFITDIDDPLVIESIGVLKEYHGIDGDPTSFPAWSDAGILANFTKSSCVIIGPGNLELAHTTNEYVGVDELEKARVFYRELALKYCELEAN